MGSGIAALPDAGASPTSGPMQALLVMTVLGRDRPGLVDSVAEAIARHGGNWLESRMARLGGQFAGILRVSVPVEQRAALERALADLAEQGLTVVVHADESLERPSGWRAGHLEVVGQDRPGIVRQIAHALAEAGVNVEELKSECRSAAMSGEPIFQATFLVALPPRCPLDALRQSIEQIAEDLIVDIQFREEPPAGHPDASAGPWRDSPRG
jgi:glycine cleavage system regulatory protein